MTTLSIFLPALLAGCGLFAGPNYMRAKGDAPVDLGRVESALWVDSSEYYSGNGWNSAYGRGQLLMSTESVSCEELDDFEDEGVWNSEGLFANFRWSADGTGDVDLGYEGEYYGGVDHEGWEDGVAFSRSFEGAVFGDGGLYYFEYARGVAEVSDWSEGEVSGRLETSLYVARFQAENCGSRIRSDGGDDTAGGWEDTGRRR